MAERAGQAVSAPSGARAGTREDARGRDEAVRQAAAALAYGFHVICGSQTPNRFHQALVHMVNAGLADPALLDPLEAALAARGDAPADLPGVPPEGYHDPAIPLPRRDPAECAALPETGPPAGGPLFGRKA